MLEVGKQNERNFLFKSSTDIVLHNSILSLYLLSEKYKAWGGKSAGCIVNSLNASVASLSLISVIVVMLFLFFFFFFD